MLIVRSNFVLRLSCFVAFAGLAASAAAQPASLTTAFVKVETGMTLPTRMRCGRRFQARGLFPTRTPGTPFTGNTPSASRKT